jgi:hypothetical protein
LRQPLSFMGEEIMRFDQAAGFARHAIIPCLQVDPGHLLFAQRGPALQLKTKAIEQATQFGFLANGQGQRIQRIPLASRISRSP